MAAGEGFEPSQTESESVVLPLHNPAISFRLRPRAEDIGYYSRLKRKVNPFFRKIQKTF